MNLQPLEQGDTDSRLTSIGDEHSRAMPVVLLIEDNSDMRGYLRKHLARHYQVQESTRGDEGLALARSNLPDIVVSDIMMPGLDGHALCRCLKADPETDFIPVVLLTARTDQASRLEGLDGGADDYLTKPFEPDELLLRLRNLLRVRQRLAARFGGLPQPLPPPAAVPTCPTDAGFMARLNTVLRAEAGDPDFDILRLASLMSMSRAGFNRQCVKVLGMPPAEALVRFRLDRAAQLLSSGVGSVGEVSDAVGFRNVSHFVRRFREHFGQTPARFRANSDLNTGNAAVFGQRPSSQPL